jgi:hypothetical protein
MSEDDLDFAHPLRAPTSHYSWPTSLPWSRRIPLVLLPQLTERIWQGDKGYPSSPYIAISKLRNPRTDDFAELLRRCAAVGHRGGTWFLFSERANSLGHLVLDDSILGPGQDGNLLRVVGNPQTCSIRHPPPKACNGTAQFTPDASSKIPRHNMAEHAVDATRPTLDQHFGNLSSRHGSGMDARVLLGPKGGCAFRLESRGHCSTGRRRGRINE